MENKPTSGFKIGSDDDIPDPFAQPKRQNFTAGMATSRTARTDVRRLALINRRLTLLSVLLPILLAVIVGGGYFIVKKEMAKIQSGGISDLQTSVQNMKEQITALNEKFGKIEAAAEAKEAPMEEALLVFERTSAAVEEKLKKINSRLKQMDSDKAENSEIEALAEELKSEQKKSLEGVTEQVQTLSAAVEPLKPLPESIKQLQEAAMQSDEKQAEALAGLTQSIETVQGNINAVTEELNKTKTEMVDVLSGTIDKNGLTQAMSSYARKYRKEVDLLAKNLESKDRSIRRLQQDIKRLEQEIANLSKRRTTSGKPTKRGSFTEQDLSN